MTKANSSSTTATSSRCDSSQCSVDSILNEMSRSFSHCKSTKLFQFYNGSTTSSSALDSPRSTTGNCTAFSWSNLSSIDFWNTVNLSGLSGATASDTTTTTSRGTHLLYEKIGSLSNQLITENRIVASVTQQIEEKLSNFMANTMQITTTGVILGAVAGAAVATGVIVGMMAATGAIGAAASAYSSSDSNSVCLPSFLQRLRRHLGFERPNQPEENGGSSSNSNNHTSSSKTNNSCSVSTSGPLVILQGYPSCSSEQTAEEQCRSCLSNVESNLRQEHGLEWCTIRRLSVCLVLEKCKASTFRQILDQYHYDATDDTNTTTPMPLVSILFVQQLEEETAMLQVEAMASQ